MFDLCVVPWWRSYAFTSWILSLFYFLKLERKISNVFDSRSNERFRACSLRDLSWVFSSSHKDVYAPRTLLRIACMWAPRLTSPPLQCFFWIRVHSWVWGLVRQFISLIWTFPKFGFIWKANAINSRLKSYCTISLTRAFHRTSVFTPLPSKSWNVPFFLYHRHLSEFVSMDVFN